MRPLATMQLGISRRTRLTKGFLPTIKLVNLSTGGRGSTPRLLPLGSFFYTLYGTPTEKVSCEGQRFRKTEVAELPIPSHTDVVADHAHRKNYIILNEGIGTCLDVTA